MGQYYKAVLIDEDGLIKTFCPREYETEDSPYGMGAKLTEHAWLPNPFVNAVIRHIIDKPLQLGWVGDYARDTELPEEILALCNVVYSESQKDTSLAQIPPLPLDCDHLDWFFVNETKKVYLDLKTYFLRSIESDGRHCAHPVPLLTAIGNGMGGGDYHGINEKEVGAWAFDEVYITQARPDRSQYTEEMYTFNEEACEEKSYPLY